MILVAYFGYSLVVSIRIAPGAPVGYSFVFSLGALGGIIIGTWEWYLVVSSLGILISSPLGMYFVYTLGYLIGYIFHSNWVLFLSCFLVINLTLQLIPWFLFCWYVTCNIYWNTYCHTDGNFICKLSVQIYLVIYRYLNWIIIYHTSGLTPWLFPWVYFGLLVGPPLWAFFYSDCWYCPIYNVVVIVSGSLMGL